MNEDVIDTADLHTHEWLTRRILWYVHFSPMEQRPRKRTHGFPNREGLSKGSLGGHDNLTRRPPSPKGRPVSKPGWAWRTGTGLRHLSPGSCGIVQPGAAGEGQRRDGVTSHAQSVEGTWETAMRTVTITATPAFAGTPCAVLEGGAPATHLTGQDNEAQRGRVTCLRSHSRAGTGA